MHSIKSTLREKVSERDDSEKVPKGRGNTLPRDFGEGKWDGGDTLTLR